MDNDNYGFRDDEERKAFYIALPVIALFGGLLYYFVFGSDKPAVPVIGGSLAILDSDGDGIADHVDRCANEEGTIDNHGCLLPINGNKKDEKKTTAKRDRRTTTQRVTRGASEAMPVASEFTPTETVELVETEAPVVEERVAAFVEAGVDESEFEIVAPEVEVATGTVVLEAVEAKPLDMDEDGVPDTEDKCPEVAGVADSAGCLASLGSAATADSSAVAQVVKPVSDSEQRLIQDAGFNIRFEPGNAVLTGESREILLEIANVMGRNPDIHLETHGFTDNEGSDELNENLSRSRAQACIDVIAGAGIDSIRLAALGFGAERPIATNDTPEGREQNRRVEFKLVR